MKKSSRKEAEEKISEFFADIKNKKPVEIKKIKMLAMRYNLKLGNKRKLFCKKCFSTQLKTISTKRNVKKVRCEKCGEEYRWKINSS